MQQRTDVRQFVPHPFTSATTLGPKGKPFLVSVERWKGAGRREASVSVMLWSVGRRSELVEAHQFRSHAELRAWLVGVAAVCGAKNVAVDWTTTLRANRTLASLVTECLAPPTPQSA